MWQGEDKDDRRGTTPGVFTKSAQTVERKGDDLRESAREREKSADEYENRALIEALVCAMRAEGEFTGTSYPKTPIAEQTLRD